VVTGPLSRGYDRYAVTRTTRHAGRMSAREATATDRWTVVMIAELAAAAIEPFDDYERRVLPLLNRHGGRLERRLRTADARTEVHLLSFRTRADYDSYLADPARTALRPLLAALDLRQRILEVHDVPW
jgi:hypothetical protein